MTIDITALLTKLVEEGPYAAMLVAVVALAWKAGREVWATFKVWGERLLQHWIESGKARDAAYSRIHTDMQVGFAAHEQRDLERHQKVLAAIHGSANATRDELRDEHRETRRVCRQDTGDMEIDGVEEAKA
jgi:hypothetical protein